MRTILIVYLLVVFFTAAVAQDSEQPSILTSSPSPKLNAAAGIGVALPTTDAYGQFYNPSQVAYAARHTNFTIHFLPGGQNLSTDAKPELKSSAVNLGYQVRSPNTGQGISIGIGYINSDMDLGELILTDTTGQQQRLVVQNENYYSIAFAIGFSYFVDFHLGLGYKWFTTNPGFIQDPDFGLVRAIDRLGTWDYGALITAPLHRFIFPGGKDRDLIPKLDFSIGYSKINSSNSIKYNDVTPEQPLPRTARLGYSIRGGLEFSHNRKRYQAFEAFFSVEANDLLVEETTDGFDYQGFLGDINISKHIIQAQGDDNVISRVGYGIDLLETVYFAAGYYQGAGFAKTTTLGYGVRTKALFRFLRKKYTKNVFSFILDSMDFQYYTSTYSVIANQEVRFHGIMVSVTGF